MFSSSLEGKKNYPRMETVLAVQLMHSINTLWKTRRKFNTEESFAKKKNQHTFIKIGISDFI